MPDDVKFEGITKEDVSAQVAETLNDIEFETEIGDRLESVSGISGLESHSSVIYNLHGVAISLGEASNIGNIGNFRPNNNLEFFVDGS